MAFWVGAPSLFIGTASRSGPARKTLAYGLAQPPAGNQREGRIGMVNRNLLRQYDLPDDELRRELDDTFNHHGADWLPPEEQEFRDNHVVTGRVCKVTVDEVWLDVGYKSEGAVELREWYDESQGKVVAPQPGDQLDVLVKAVEDECGTIILSYRGAKRQKDWKLVVEKHREGDAVSGVVSRKIKGGLLVNIGVNVFLPASQVDIRRPPDIGVYLGKTIECKIVVIDEARHNIVVSRRQLIEDQREQMKKKLLAEIEPGQIRQGVVKNIADFGAFVDLGGIDGLLHITDMAWSRLTSPHEAVHIDQRLDVFVIRVDKEKEKIALGLKQKTPSPWATVAEKYAVGSRSTGEVVTVMNYGAFVKLEPGVEGLVHISEMSWTKRINHPGELLTIGDHIEVQILNINKEKQEMSLGMKQVQTNPVGQDGREVSRGHHCLGHRAEPCQLRGLYRDRGRDRRSSARRRHELGPQGQPR